ncbi:MAG: hypothetical protein ACR2KJ_00695 [Jatrophihabitans sp.]
MSVLRSVSGNRPAGLAFLWALVLTAVLLWPLHRAGLGLGHDMVFTPDQPLTWSGLGLGSAAPRAVPLDALVALAGKVVGGATVTRLALAIPLLAAGAGCGLLLRRGGALGAVAGAAFAVWNPYVIERLALGQWALLWSYAALPWIVLALRGRHPTRSWAGVTVAVAAASITPTGGVVAALFAVCCACAIRRPGATWRVAVTAAALQLPWLLAGALSTATTTSDPAAVGAFAARNEHAGGVVLTLLGGGGIWNADVVPGSRSSGLAWAGLAVVAVSAAVGWRPLRDVIGRRMFVALLVAAGVGFALAALPSLPGGASVLRFAVAHLPGAGVLRDAQKWVLPWVVLQALLFASAAGRAGRAIGRAPALVPAAIAAALLPVLLVPDAGATLRPTLSPVTYPSDWAQVARLVGDDGDVAVVPYSAYRLYPWAPGRSVLDPAPRILPAGTIVDDRLVVGGRVLRGEDQRAAAVGSALTAADPATALAAQRVQWVLVEKDTSGTVPTLTGLSPRYDGPDLALFRVPGDIAPPVRGGSRTAAVLAGYGIAGLVAFGGLGMLLVAALTEARGLLSSWQVRRDAGG